MNKVKIVLFLILTSFCTNSVFALPGFESSASKEELEAKLKAEAVEKQKQEKLTKEQIEAQKQEALRKQKEQEEKEFEYIKATTSLIKEPESKSKTIKDFTYSRNRTFNINVRESMTSTIVLPESEAIKNIILGDENSFFIEQLEDNIFMVFAQEINRDTSITAISDNKTIYAFYAKSIAYNSKETPDLVIRINDSFSSNSLAVKSKSNSKSLNTNQKSNSKEFHKEYLEEDYLTEVPLDPNNIDWNYKMKGEKSIAPKRVWNDGYFTYFEFDEKQPAALAYKVVEQVDTPITATKWQDNIMIVKTIGDITLRAGDKFVCIRPQSKGLKTKRNIKYIPFI